MQPQRNATQPHICQFNNDQYCSITAVHLGTFNACLADTHAPVPGDHATRIAPELAQVITLDYPS